MSDWKKMCLLASYFSLFLFWASLSHFLFTPGLAAVWNLIGHAWCSHGCLLWCGSSRVSSSIRKNNRNSEWFLIIIWEPLCRMGTNFRKKWKTSHFFLNLETVFFSTKYQLIKMIISHCRVLENCRFYRYRR
jgi:hypothetical protein